MERDEHRRVEADIDAGLIAHSCRIIAAELIGAAARAQSCWWWRRYVAAAPRHIRLFEAHPELWIIKKVTIQIQLKKGMLFSGNPTLSSGCMTYMLRIC